MKIYVAHARAFDFENELYKPLRNSTLVKRHEFIFPHAGATFNSKEEIKNADLILAEVSHPAIGEGIELGWANAFNKRILCIYKVGAKLSSSLDYLNADKIAYSDLKDLITKLTNAIT